MLSKYIASLNDDTFSLEYVSSSSNLATCDHVLPVKFEASIFNAIFIYLRIYQSSFASYLSFLLIASSSEICMPPLTENCPPPLII